MPHIQVKKPYKNILLKKYPCEIYRGKLKETTRKLGLLIPKVTMKHFYFFENVLKIV